MISDTLRDTLNEYIFSLSFDSKCLLLLSFCCQVYLLDFFCFGIQLYVLLSHYLCFISFLYLDLYVFGDLGVFHANQTSMCLDPHLN